VDQSQSYGFLVLAQGPAAPASSRYSGSASLEVSTPGALAPSTAVFDSPLKGWHLSLLVESLGSLLPPSWGLRVPMDLSTVGVHLQVGFVQAKGGLEKGNQPHHLMP
jgi:hypothetical protein